jgi:hypothetical protein
MVKEMGQRRLESCDTCTRISNTLDTMPSSDRIRKEHARTSNLTLMNNWECPFCFKVCSRYRNAHKKHPPACPKRPELLRQAVAKVCCPVGYNLTALPIYFQSSTVESVFEEPEDSLDSSASSETATSDDELPAGRKVQASHTGEFCP